MQSTVVVTPRERFTPLVRSLRSLFDTTSADTPVMVIDGGAPESVRTQLRALQRERPFELIENDRYILPNVARNIALDRVDTKYIAFCDNDIEYHPGWLEALERNAEENNAVGVSPVTLLGPMKVPPIHHAGSDFVLRLDSQGRRKLKEIHRLKNLTIAQAEARDPNMAPLDSKGFEYHCSLLNVEAMRAVGGHDERLILHDHTDASLRLMLNGGRLTFEPAARIMYRAIVKFADEDWPYFLYRWAVHRAVESDRIFGDYWNIYKDPDATPREFVGMHRDRAMSTILPKLPKAFRNDTIRRLLLMFYRPRIEKMDPRQPDDPDPRCLPKPPDNALETLGITPQPG